MYTAADLAHKAANLHAFIDQYVPLAPAHRGAARTSARIMLSYRKKLCGAASGRCRAWT